MKINASEILASLKKDHRVRRTFIVSSTVYKDFQRACGDVAVSTVLEELMRQFSESARAQKKSEK